MFHPHYLTSKAKLVHSKPSPTHVREYVQGVDVRLTRRTTLTLRATRGTPHGSSRLVHTQNKCLPGRRKPDVVHPGSCRDARVHGHNDYVRRRARERNTPDELPTTSSPIRGESNRSPDFLVDHNARATASFPIQCGNQFRSLLSHATACEVCPAPRVGTGALLNHSVTLTNSTNATILATTKTKNAVSNTTDWATSDSGFINLSAHSIPAYAISAGNTA